MNKNFSLDFKARVLKVVRSIKRGRTMSYGEVARRARKPGAARAVGAIMAANTDTNVPCHRVIRADGSLGGYNAIRGPSKRQLLEREGAL